MSGMTIEPATRQLELLRSGEISVVELAEAHIQQIERLNPQLNVFADFDAERVRERARKHDEWRGTRSRRPLFGLPVTVKSSIATRGFKCEIGSRLHEGEVPREDAVVVARLRAAGALILGTTNCPEFLMAYETANLLHGRTNNPWDLERTPGGSSGGESAAIAAGLSAAGLGSRQRRLGARAGALHRHLLAEANAGAHSRSRPSAAVCGTVFDAGRDWTDGAHDGRCCADVPYAQRT